MFPEVSFSRKALALETLKFYLADWKRLGIQGPIEVTWDGSGDSGVLNTEPITPKDERLLAESGYVFNWGPENASGFLIQEGNGDIHVKVESAKKTLFAVLCSALPLGWEINDGTSGTITLDVQAMSITIDGVAHYLEHEDDLCYSTKEWSQTF